MTAVFEAIGSSAPDRISNQLFDLFHGSLELTLDGCVVAGTMSIDKNSSGATGPDAAEQLLKEFQKRTRNYFLELLRAVIEEGWYIRYGHRVSHSNFDERRPPYFPLSFGPPGEKAKAVPIDKKLTQDPVFIGLHGSLLQAATTRLSTAPDLVRLFDSACVLGKNILADSTESPAVRFMAFAVSAFIQAPRGLVSTQYVPAYSNEIEKVRFGHLLCELFLSADLSKELVVTEETLQEYFRKKGVDLIPRRLGTPTLPRIARRIRKLQDTLRIVPPLFRVDEDITKITVWEPNDLSLFGDIRPWIKDLQQKTSEEDPEED